MTIPGEAVKVISGLEERNPDQGRLIQLEPGLSHRQEILFKQVLLRGRLKPAPINLFQPYFYASIDNLYGRIETIPFKRGPQGPMPVNDLAPALFKSRNVQLAFQLTR